MLNVRLAFLSCMYFCSFFCWFMLALPNRYKIMHNVIVYMKNGEFGTRQPVTGSGLTTEAVLFQIGSPVRLTYFLLLNSILSDGASVD